MTQMPNNTFFDDTFALARDPYRFISKQCERHGSDAFETRLLLQKVICLRGEEAAKAFYDTSRFSRVSVAPPRIAKTLFGRGGVQGMDGKAHRHRKMMFMSLLTEDKIGGAFRLCRQHRSKALVGKDRTQTQRSLAAWNHRTNSYWNLSTCRRHRRVHRCQSLRSRRKLARRSNRCGRAKQHFASNGRRVGLHRSVCARLERASCDSRTTSRMICIALCRRSGVTIHSFRLPEQR